MEPQTGIGYNTPADAVSAQRKTRDWRSAMRGGGCALDHKGVVGMSDEEYLIWLCR